MLRTFSFWQGTIVVAALLCVCGCQQQSGGKGSGGPGPMGGGPAVKATVVADYATSTFPTSRKKYVGTVDPIEKVDSIARVAGDLVVAEGFAEGSVVKKGQLLFEIDPIRYEANVKIAEATIEQMKARVAYAQNNYQRLLDLFEKNAGSRDDYENALSDLRSFEAQLASAEAQLILAKEDLRYAKIYSMLDGRAGRVEYTTGNYVSATSKPLVTVVQTDPIYVGFTISERDFAATYGGNLETLKKTAEIQLTLANDEVYDEVGEITFINNEVKTTTDTIRIWATFENKNGRLNPGGVVTVELKKREESSAAAVQPSAVMFDGTCYYVYVLVDELSNDELFDEILADARFVALKDAFENGEKTKEAILEEFLKRYEYVDPTTAEKTYDFRDGKVVDPQYKLVLRRNVVVGSTDGGIEAILSGLQPGEFVVTDGTHKIKPFELARPVSRAAESVGAPAGTASLPILNESAEDALQNVDAEFSAARPNEGVAL